MHAVWEEGHVGGGGLGRRGEALRDYGAAVDTACAGRVPEFAIWGGGGLGAGYERKGGGGAGEGYRVFVKRSWRSRSAVEVGKRLEGGLTGPMTERSLSSRTFSMGDLDASAGLGGMRVGPGMLGERLNGM